MNGAYVVSVAIMIVSMSVSGSVFGRLPAPQFLDTEVSAQYRLDQSGAVNILDFSLVFNGTPSNNVEVAFVYVGHTPGEANDFAASTGKAVTSTTTEYPYGGSDFAVRTDARGVVTVIRKDPFDDGIVETLQKKKAA